MTIDVKPAPPDFKLLSLDDCANAPPRPYVVKGLISPGDFGMVYGQPGTGKSVLAPHLALCVAAGKPFFGRRVRRGPVLYVAGEDHGGIKQRFAALRREHGPVPGLHLIADEVNLSWPHHQHAIGSLLLDLEPVLVVYDTMASVLPGLEENDATEMAEAVGALRGNSLACQSAVVAVHHSPKSGDTPRGHSILNGNLDVTLYVQGSGTDQRTVTPMKCRSGPSGVPFAFNIKVADLGADADGDPITAPIVDPDRQGEPCRCKPGWEPTGHARNVYNTLNDLVVRGVGTAQPPPGANVPEGVVAVKVSDWRKSFMRKSAPDDAEGSDRGGGKAKEGTARKAFDRSWPQLQANGFVGIFDGWAWSAKR